MIKSRNGTCPNCNKSYLKKRSDQKYCSTDCRVEHNNQVLKEKYKSIKTLKRNQKQTDKEYQGKEKELLDKIEQLQAELEALEYQKLTSPRIIMFKDKKRVSSSFNANSSQYVEIENNLETPLYVISDKTIYELWDCRMFKKQ
jgi:uncharacterized phage infection (PIP) family protein YhgE